MKHYEQKLFGEKRVCSVYTPTSLRKSGQEPKQDRDDLEAGADAEAMEECSSVRFFIDPGPPGQRWRHPQWARLPPPPPQSLILKNALQASL